MLAPRAVKRKTAAKASPTSNGAELATSTNADAQDAEAVTGASTAATGSEDAASQILANEVAGTEENGTSLIAAEAAEPKSQNGEAGIEASTSSKDGPVMEDPQERKKEKERLSLLKYTIEESLSDWGLSYQHPELLKKYEASMTGCE